MAEVNTNGEARCGCAVKTEGSPGMVEAVGIDFCPLHAAAPALLEALELRHGHPELGQAYCDACTVIAQALGEPAHA